MLRPPLRHAESVGVRHVRKAFGQSPDALGGIDTAKTGVRFLLRGSAAQMPESARPIEPATLRLGRGGGVEGWEFRGLDGPHENAPFGQRADQPPAGHLPIATELRAGGEQVRRSDPRSGTSAPGILVCRRPAPIPSLALLSAWV